MFEFVNAQDVTAGMLLNFEYAPAREADALVNRVEHNEDGTTTIFYDRFGPVGPYNYNEQVLRVG